MDKTALIAETGRCVACGLCLPHCPTYRKTQSEADSPRGRILMTQAVAQGVLPANERYAEHMDLCLTCRACESVCPNQVNYGKVADEARAMIRGTQPMPRMLRLATWLFERPRLMRFGGGLLRLAHKFGLKHGPQVSQQYRWQDSYPAESAQGEVALFLGCVTNAIDAETLASAIYVLNRLGYTVHVPSSQGCCGGLHRQAGDRTGAEALEANNQAAFSRYGDLPILSVASGCGARLAEYLPKRAQDINVFLSQAQGWDRAKVQPLPAKVVVQEPCTLRNALDAKGSQQVVLKRIPSLEVVALPGNAQCCGGAGSYVLTQPEMANRLRDDKIIAYQTIESDYLVTANIGCAMHLASGFNRAGEAVQIMHPVVLLARQMGFTGEI
ncbi:glycolate oxidase iron-sulfur subunit [Novimethylophilus kurashikiensis]|uniref:Glycolate oxidase iron-sulfur subunit n=1 Tax=Novimethylophilus kurashikiensis TaxID=1825523 RepID=A0A2R5F4U5_9PROT|nr:(Fe-S)-binding protein [Novimethylophilus kurashikiensis]GBG13420.1 glycolate oxidase iron-sulfur subunit [Novimethylophilus kurashikiensis]